MLCCSVWDRAELGLSLQRQLPTMAGKALPPANIPCLHGTLWHGGHSLCLHGHALTPGILRPRTAHVKGAATQSKHVRNEDMKWQCLWKSNHNVWR